jgi:hypothetical protein
MTTNSKDLLRLREIRDCPRGRERRKGGGGEGLSWNSLEPTGARVRLIDVGSSRTHTSQMSEAMSLICPETDPLSLSLSLLALPSLSLFLFSLSTLFASSLFSFD